MSETVRTKYVGPVGFQGSKIVVFWKGRGQKSVPFDYAASDVDESAVRSAAEHFGVDVASIARTGTTVTGYRFEVTPA